MKTVHKITGIEVFPVETLKDELVVRMRNGWPTKKPYKVIGYCRTNKAYELCDCNDISFHIYLKKGTLVAKWEE